MENNNTIDIYKVPKDVSIQYRSCWNCNKAKSHIALKESDSIITCFLCGKSYYKGKEIVSYTEDEKEIKRIKK